MNLFSQLAKARNFGKCILWNTRQTECCFHTSQRTQKQVLTRTLRIKHEDFYKRLDNIPQEYEMIYKLPLHYTMNMGKAAALLTSISIPGAWLYYHMNRVSDQISYFIGTSAATQEDLMWFIAALMATNVIIFRCCHVVALRVYRYQKSYVAIIPGIVPRFNNQLHFQEGELKEHFKALSFFRELTYKINGRTVLLIPERFRKSTDLFDMLDKTDSKKYKS